MALKIFGGKAKGLVLTIPTKGDVRPTASLLKRKVFDSFQDFDGVTFFDLCAGSGSVGLEAASRNADAVYFVEKDKAVFEILKKNISVLEDREDCKDTSLIAYLSPVENWFTRFRAIYKKFPKEQKENTILFLDPPYEKIKIYEDVIFAEIAKSNFIGQLWIESDNLKGIHIDEWEKKGLTTFKKFSQGDSYILIINY